MGNPWFGCWSLGCLVGPWGSWPSWGHAEQRSRAGFTPCRMLSCCWVSPQRARHLLWLGDIRGVEPQLGTRDKGSCVGLCQGQHLPGLVSLIWALSTKQRA